MTDINTGLLIKELRLSRKLSQTELGAKLNVTDKAISKWETGGGTPDRDSLKSLSKEFSISTDELLAGKLAPKVKIAKKEESISCLAQAVKNGIDGISKLGNTNPSLLSRVDDDGYNIFDYIIKYKQLELLNSMISFMYDRENSYEYSHSFQEVNEMHVCKINNAIVHKHAVIDLFNLYNIVTKLLKKKHVDIAISLINNFKRCSDEKYLLLVCKKLGVNYLPMLNISRQTLKEYMERDIKNNPESYEIIHDFTIKVLEKLSVTVDAHGNFDSVIINTAIGDKPFIDICKSDYYSFNYLLKRAIDNEDESILESYHVKQLEAMSLYMKNDESKKLPYMNLPLNKFIIDNKRNDLFEKYMSNWIFFNSMQKDLSNTIYRSYKIKRTVEGKIVESSWDTCSHYIHPIEKEVINKCLIFHDYYYNKGVSIFLNNDVFIGRDGISEYCSMLDYYFKQYDCGFDNTKLFVKTVIAFENKSIFSKQVKLLNHKPDKINFEHALHALRYKYFNTGVIDLQETKNLYNASPFMSENVFNEEITTQSIANKYEQYLKSKLELKRNNTNICYELFRIKDFDLFVTVMNSIPYSFIEEIFITSNNSIVLGDIKKIKWIINNITKCISTQDLVTLQCNSN